MKHGPRGEHADLYRLGHSDDDLEVPVVAANTFEGGLNRCRRSLEQLKEYVLPAHQRSGNIVAGIAAPGIQKNAVEGGFVISKRLRRIDELDEVRDGDVS